MKKKRSIALMIVFTVTACKINYSFSGASITPDMKTYSVQTFVNRAPIFQPSIAYELTNTLKDKIQSQTPMKLVNKNSSVRFEGEITDYSTREVAVQGDNLAAQTRLTVTVRVKYVNENNPKQNFEDTFSRYADYPTSRNLSDVENDLIKTIVEQLSEDIFNKAFVNW